MAREARYSSLIAAHYTTTFPPTSYAVWTGRRHFYVQSNYKATPDSDGGSPPPTNLPMWDDWVKQFADPVGSAYNPASGLRFTLYVNKNAQYAFAMKAEVAPQQDEDVVVYTLLDLENWEVEMGLDPEDRQSAGAGGFLTKLINIAVAFLFRLLPLAIPGWGFVQEQYREWRMWGGLYQTQP